MCWKGGSFSTATAINAGGQVVGYSATATGSYNVFLYSDGTMKDLGNLGYGSASPRGINARGQIVGEAHDVNRSTCFLYSDGLMMDLNTLLDPSASGWRLGDANAINDNGLIVGSALSPDGGLRAVLLIPVPEPSSLALLALGLLMLKTTRRRRNRARSKTPPQSPFFA